MDIRTLNRQISSDRPHDTSRIPRSSMPMLEIVWILQPKPSIWVRLSG